MKPIMDKAQGITRYMASLLHSQYMGRSKILQVLTIATLSACGGGGGGSSGAPSVEATITSILPAQITVTKLTGTQELAFPITFSKPTVAANIVVQYSTVSTSKAGMSSPSLGSAVAGSSCIAGVDFIGVTNATISIPAGSASSKIPITVCPASPLAAAPNKTFLINWSSPTLGANGSIKGTLINTIEGGLSSSGAKVAIGGTAVFGRDTNLLTNSDADGHAGLAYEPRPSSADWKCTFDLVTGLIWEKTKPLDSTYLYNDVDTYINQVNLAQPCGISNWRRPTVNELTSIVDSSLATGASADAFGFFNLKAEPYWTGESVANASSNAWAVDFGNLGAVSFFNKATSQNRVLLVSAPPVAAESCNTVSSRYVINRDSSNVPDSTVSDLSTGLMWKQCTEGLTGVQCQSGTVVAFTTVQQVLDRISSVNADLNLGLGYNDWRLPTRNELSSIVNLSCPVAPAINSVVFPNTDAKSYLTATTDASNSGRLWAVNFVDGSVLVVDPATAGGREIRLVRAGR